MYAPRIQSALELHQNTKLLLGVLSEWLSEIRRSFERQESSGDNQTTRASLPIWRPGDPRERSKGIVLIPPLCDLLGLAHSLAALEAQCFSGFSKQHQSTYGIIFKNRRYSCWHHCAVIIATDLCRQMLNTIELCCAPCPDDEDENSFPIVYDTPHLAWRVSVANWPTLGSHEFLSFLPNILDGFSVNEPEIIKIYPNWFDKMLLWDWRDHEKQQEVDQLMQYLDVEFVHITDTTLISLSSEQAIPFLRDADDVMGEQPAIPATEEPAPLDQFSEIREWLKNPRSLKGNQRRIVEKVVDAGGRYSLEALEDELAWSSVEAGWEGGKGARREINRKLTIAGIPFQLEGIDKFAVLERCENIPEKSPKNPRKVPRKSQRNPRR